jgi:aldehyde dehydrogenase (NAD+)
VSTLVTDLATDHTTVYIDGELVRASASERIELISPWSEQVFASVPSGGSEDMDRAVASARRALDSGPWPSTTVEERIAVVLRFRDLVVEHLEDYAALITEQMGCPITQARTIQVPAPVAVLEGYVQDAREYLPTAVRRSKVGQSLVLRQPVGVVAGVVPWNVPLSLSIQKIVPALLTGCTVVLKPSPETPLDAYLTASLLGEAGLPPGVVNVVPADREASEYLISHPGVDKVTFTGSSAAGRRIAEICGRDLRRVTLELGGKSAAVVLEDADLDQVMSSLRLGSFRNNGQICSLKTRLLVPESRHSEFLERLIALVDSMPVGDPHDEATQIGPLVSSRQRDRVEGFIASGKAEGARLVCGGERPAGLEHGWFVEPTVFTDVAPSATIAQEEIFGPVVAVIPYRSENEAVAIANNSQYGLNGAVFTADLERGIRVAAKIQTGTVELNGNPAGARSPMGGVKRSGVGREYGPEGLSAFVETKAITLPNELADSLEAAQTSY